MVAAVLETSRLRLRPWRDSDLTPFAVLNADPVVMEHFVEPLDRAASDAFVSDRIRPHFEQYGYGPWAVEVTVGPSPDAFIGFVGLMWQDFEAPFTPALEVGWRLSASAWGLGYATEAARAAVDYAFDVAGAPEVVSMTAPANLRSIAVMQRLGMSRDPGDDFDHPRVPEGHRLRRHVLYRIGPEGRTW
ncbi:MAG: GNAT family N-acetyltransferase [Actinomycetes bacterium]